jgi:hypothetical protein
MKFNRKRIVLGLLIVLLAVLAVPEFIFYKAKGKYRIGITAGKIRPLAPTNNPLVRTGVTYPTGISEDSKRTGYYYYLRIPKEFLVLEFNYYEEIVGVRRNTPLAKLIDATEP